MHVRVLIERHIKEGREKEALDHILEMREAVTKHPGYVSGETLTDNDDPRTIIIVSTWHALQEWNHWEASEEHRRLSSSIEPMLEEPAEVRVFVNPWDALHEE